MSLRPAVKIHGTYRRTGIIWVLFLCTLFVTLPPLAEATTMSTKAVFHWSYYVNPAHYNYYNDSADYFTADQFLTFTYDKSFYCPNQTVNLSGTAPTTATCSNGYGTAPYITSIGTSPNYYFGNGTDNSNLRWNSPQYYSGTTGVFNVPFTAQGTPGTYDAPITLSMNYPPDPVTGAVYTDWTTPAGTLSYIVGTQTQCGNGGACSSNIGKYCASPVNACGQSSTGAIQCDGSCSGGSSAPPLPVGYGQSCTSAANTCGKTQTGTIQCDGTCSATTPPLMNCPPTASLYVSSTTAGLALNQYTTSVFTNQHAYLKWNTTNSTSCTSVGGFNANGATSTNLLDLGVNATAGTYYYQIYCDGSATTSPNYLGYISFYWGDPTTWAINCDHPFYFPPNGCLPVHANNAVQVGGPSLVNNTGTDTPYQFVAIYADPATANGTTGLTAKWFFTSYVPFAGGPVPDTYTGTSFATSTISAGGRAYSNTVTVNVISPSATISASPSRVSTGSTTSLTWNATGVQDCSVKKNGATIPGLASTTAPGYTWSSSLLDAITTQTTYQIFCDTFPLTPMQYTTATQIVNVTGTFNGF